MGHTRSRRRIHFLDELRGFCVILMVFYHAFYTVGYMFGLSFAQTLFDFFSPAEPFFAGLFIFLCGLSCNLSHNNVKRGALLLAVAVALSLVLWLGVQGGLLHRSSLIWFGVLHCLAVCILLYALLYPTIRFVPAWLGVLLCAVLFLCTYHVSPSEGGYVGISGLFRLPLPVTELNHPLLYPLGLCPVSIAGDYFPLLPWFFCFLTGSYVGVWHGSFPKWMYRCHSRVFARLGRWSLWIYLAHQPVIFGLCYLITFIIKAFP